MSRSLVAASWLSVIATCPLLAYTDPGSGALLIQILLATVTGVIFTIRKFLVRLWRKDRQ